MDRRQLKTKSAIRKAFVELMGKKSLENITVTEIAEHADIDRKTFYLHYSAVLDVYRDLENEVSNSLQELLDTDGAIDFSVFFTGLNEIMQRDFEFYKIISERDSYSFLITECTKLFTKKLIEKYGGKNRIRAEYAASGIISVYVSWLKNPDGVTLEQIVASLLEITEKILI